MKHEMYAGKIKYPLKYKMFTLVLIAMVPLLSVTVYLIFSLLNYSNSYDSIVSNMTIANNYNLNFKEEMDESIYKLAVGYVTFDMIDEDPTLQNPYTLLEELRSEFNELMKITTDRESRGWLQSLLRNIDTLEDRIDDIRENIERGGQYEENIEMLDNNIYILTELIQDDIQYYIYYQTESIDHLKTQLNSQVYSFIVFWTVMIAVIVLLAVVITSLILNSIIKPVEELCRVTERIADGDFESRAGVSTKDEMSVLAQSVNDMSGHLQIMVDKIKEDERKMRHAELRLLQEQINPHFLYNTLDTIVWLIECNDAESAVNMVVALSDFFRLVLSRGNEYITIREEEQHIRSYLEIQQVRYGDILEYEIDIASDIYEYKILKLTLQPLVENSLYHGIKYKRARGLIKVTGERKMEQIVLTVQDTGVGMESEELERLRREIVRPSAESKTGFGLANVNERIRMNFGQEYGMTIESEKGKGTSIKIIIPAEYSDSVKG